MQKEHIKKVEPSEELIEKYEKLALNLNIDLLDKSVSLKYNKNNRD